MHRYLTMFDGTPAAKPSAYEFERQPETGIVTRICMVPDALWQRCDAPWQWVRVLTISWRTTITVEPAAQPTVLTTAEGAWFYACERCIGEGTLSGNSGRILCPRCQGKCYDPSWGEVLVVTTPRIPVIGDRVSFYAALLPGCGAVTREGTVVSFEESAGLDLRITIALPDGTQRTITVDQVVGRIYG